MAGKSRMVGKFNLSDRTVIVPGELEQERAHCSSLNRSPRTFIKTT
jgi:hypothetical protein